MSKQKKKYRNKLWFSLNDLADFVAEYTKDGKLKKDVWDFWKWLDKKHKPIKQNEKTSRKGGGKSILPLL